VEWDPARNPERLQAYSAPEHAPEPVPFYIGPPAKDSITRTVVLKDKQPEGEGEGLAPGVCRPAGRRAAGLVCRLRMWMWWPAAFAANIRCAARQTTAQHLQVVIQREAEGRGGSRHFCDAVAARRHRATGRPQKPVPAG
jgi:hypothetical protein